MPGRSSLLLILTALLGGVLSSPLAATREAVAEKELRCISARLACAQSSSKGWKASRPTRRTHFQAGGTMVIRTPMGHRVRVQKLIRRGSALVALVSAAN